MTSVYMAAIFLEDVKIKVGDITKINGDAETVSINITGGTDFNLCLDTEQAEVLFKKLDEKLHDTTYKQLDERCMTLENRVDMLQEALGSESESLNRFECEYDFLEAK